MLRKTTRAVSLNAGVTGKLPQDLQNLIRRAIHLQDHLAGNRNDLHNLRGLELMESRIRGLTKYYKGRGELPMDWDYSREGARLLVE